MINYRQTFPNILGYGSGYVMLGYLDDVSHESGLVEPLAGDCDGDVALGRVVGPHEVQLLLHVLQLTLVLKTNRFLF